MAAVAEVPKGDGSDPTSTQLHASQGTKLAMMARLKHMEKKASREQNSSSRVEQRGTHRGRSGVSKDSRLNVKTVPLKKDDGAKKVKAKKATTRKRQKFLAHLKEISQENQMRINQSDATKNASSQSVVSAIIDDDSIQSGGEEERSCSIVPDIFSPEKAKKAKKTAEGRDVPEVVETTSCMFAPDLFDEEEEEAQKESKPRSDTAHAKSSAIPRDTGNNRDAAETKSSPFSPDILDKEEGKEQGKAVPHAQEETEEQKTSLFASLLELVQYSRCAHRCAGKETRKGPPVKEIAVFNKDIEILRDVSKESLRLLPALSEMSVSTYQLSEDSIDAADSAWEAGADQSRAKGHADVPVDQHSQQPGVTQVENDADTYNDLVDHQSIKTEATSDSIRWALNKLRKFSDNSGIPFEELIVEFSFKSGIPLQELVMFDDEVGSRNFEQNSACRNMASV